MKAILGIHLIWLGLSVTGNLESSLSTSDHSILMEGNTITRVLKIGHSDSLSMTFRASQITISPRAFCNSSIKTLHLNFNTLANLGSNRGQLALYPDSLAGLDLDSLSLNRMDLTLAPDALLPIRSLNHLSLNFCNTIEVPSSLLASFPKLGSLILSNNNISIVHHHSFEALSHLWYLDLSSNNISIFESGCFAGLEELEKLDLSNNSFASLPAVFDQLPKLMELHIRDCPYLAIIDMNTLGKIPTLTALTISNTEVETLPPGIFDHLLRLQWLQLANNRITHIEKNVFNKLEALQYLFLDNNQVWRIDSHAFWGLNLRYLGLSYQSPASEKFLRQRLVIENGTFDNLIADIVYMAGTVNPDIRPGGFHGLATGLLDLRCVAMGKIDTEMFAGVSARKLDLRMNGISEIAANAFKHVIGDEVDLTSNPIELTDKENWDISDSLYIIV